MIETRPYRPADRAAFEALFKAYADHYQLGQPLGPEIARLTDLLDSGRHMSCLLAFDGDRPAGFATWTLTFPAGRSTALMMKELFVHPDMRGQGVGRHILAALTRIAETEGCERFDWQTDGINEKAQAFYAKLGAPQRKKLSYRIMRSDFTSFRDRLK